jgi:hypothetical protein
MVNYIGTGYIWIPALLFETVICIQTVFKVQKKVFGTYRLGSRLFLVLFRDGVGYYVVSIIEVSLQLKDKFTHFS